MKYALYSHVGVYWDGGARLLGVYRFFLAARLACWWHVRVKQPLRIGTVTRIRSTAMPENYYGSWDDFYRAMRQFYP